MKASVTFKKGSAALVPAMVMLNASSQAQVPNIDPPIAPIAGQVSEEPVVSLPASTLESFISERVVIRQDSGEWSEEDRSRFNVLAKRFALETITADEQVELKRLQRRRSHALAPRTYDEVKREYEIDQAVETAITAINDLIKSVRKPFGA
jgi:hypothetical protein